MPPQDLSLDRPRDAFEQMVWDCVSWRPLHSLWDLQGVPISVIVKRTWHSLLNDNLFGSAAELGYWFLFALFPTLVSASSIIGLAARHASENYDRLLHYLSLVIPPSAYGIVFETFNQIIKNSNGGKLTFGLAVALWAASAGFSAIQDSMNAVYKIKETRPYWKVRGAAVLISTLLSLLITAILSTLLAADYFARLVSLHIAHRMDRSCRAAGAAVCGHLLLGSGREAEAMALAHARRRNRHRRLGAGFDRPARLSPLLQQLHPHVRLAWSGDYPAYVVLSQRPDAAAWRRGEQRDRSRRHRKAPRRTGRLGRHSVGA
jgi:hypothetical protein